MFALSQISCRSGVYLGQNMRRVQLRTKKKRAALRDSPEVSTADELTIDISKYESGMGKAIEALSSNLSRLRVGGATPGLLDGVNVEAYGARTALQNVAQVSVRDGRTLIVNVFDEGTSSAVEKGIRAAGLNLNPVPDGQGKLKVPIPKATRETRESMRKLAQKDAENARVSTRQVRRKAMDAIKAIKDGMAKDEVKRMEKDVTKLTDKHSSLIDDMLDKKVKSIERES